MSIYFPSMLEDEAEETNYTTTHPSSRSFIVHLYKLLAKRSRPATVLEGETCTSSQPTTQSGMLAGSQQEGPRLDIPGVQSCRRISPPRPLINACVVMKSLSSPDLVTLYRRADNPAAEHRLPPSRPLCLLSIHPGRYHCRSAAAAAGGRYHSCCYHRCRGQQYQGLRPSG